MGKDTGAVEASVVTVAVVGAVEETAVVKEAVGETGVVKEAVMEAVEVGWGEMGVG